MVGFKTSTETRNSSDSDEASDDGGAQTSLARAILANKNSGAPGSPAPSLSGASSDNALEGGVEDNAENGESEAPAEPAAADRSGTNSQVTPAPNQSMPPVLQRMNMPVELWNGIGAQVQNDVASQLISDPYGPLVKAAVATRAALRKEGRMEPVWCAKEAERADQKSYRPRNNPQPSRRNSLTRRKSAADSLNEIIFNAEGDLNSLSCLAGSF